MSSISKSVDADQAPKQLSNRTFGLIFAGIFSVIAFFPVVFSEGLSALRQWALIAATVFAGPALIYPAVLQPLNNLWVKFGLMMHAVINPILMGLIFFIAVLPTGLILKLLGKDPMRRTLDKDAKTYWIPRDNAEFNKEKFKNQF